MNSLRIVGMSVFLFTLAPLSASARTPLLERYVSTPALTDKADQRATDEYASAKCQIFEDSVVLEFKAGPLWSTRTIPHRLDARGLSKILVEARKAQVKAGERDPEQLIVLYSGYLKEGATEETIDLLYNRSYQSDILTRYIDMHCGPVPSLK